jgi:hypothetical protein
VFKKASISFILMFLIFGSLVLLPERVEAGSPSCNEVNGVARTPTSVHPLMPDVPNSRPKPPKSGPGGPNVETSLRRTTSTLLSLLILIGGLASLAYVLRKLLRQIQHSPNRQPHKLWIGHIGRGAFASALLAAVLGTGTFTGIALYQTGNTSAETSVLNRTANKSKYQMTEVANDAPMFSSALEIGSTNALWVQIGGTVIDNLGNTYITGAFNGTLTFNTPQQPTTLTSTQDLDVFIAKLDSTGHTVWARQANGSTNIATGYSLDGGLAVAVDGQGNVYVGGGFVNSLAFKDATGNTVTTLGDNNSDINFELFVAKYNASGTLTWARGGGSGVADDPELEQDLDAGINGINEIVIDNAGNPYVGGTITGIDFLGEEIATEGGRDVLLARLDPANGDPVWVSTPGSINTDAVMGMGIDAAANLYIIGDIGGTITFPTQPPTTFVLEDEFGDAFIAKYDKNGQALWAKQIGGVQPIDAEHIAVSTTGQIYLTGAFEGTAKFDSITVNDQTNGSGSSGFLVKYNTDGNALWVRTFGHVAGGTTEGDVLGYRVSVDGVGNPYVSGTFEGEAAFGLESPVTVQTLVSEGLGDQFILHYDTTGSFRWVKQAVGSGVESENAESGADIPIEVLPMRLVYNSAAKTMTLTGDFQGTLALDGFTLNSGSSRHAFMAAVSAADTTAPTIACTPDVIANTINAGEATVAVNFAAPTASDNYPGVSVSCVPPANSSFPRGNTPVTCTATDTSNNKTTCSFTVRVFDYVIADDSNGKLLRFNSVTGDYEFFDCRKTLTLTGHGTVTMSSCKTELRASSADRNLLVQANPCTRKGSATITYAKVTHTLNDANLSSNRATCP